MQRLRNALGVIVAVLISLAITAFCAFAVIKSIQQTPLVLLDKVEHLASDLRLNYVGVRKTEQFTSPPIFVIDIDDKSLDQEGRWPWNRQKMARLTEKLQQAKVAVISFDIQFPEHTAKQFLQNMVREYHESKMPHNAEFETLTDWIAVDDKKFATQLSASKTSKTVIGFSFQHQPSASQSSTQTVAPTAIRFHGNNTTPISTLAVEGYLSSLKSFQHAANGNGAITALADSDGVLRRANLLIQNKQQLYPSLALETVRVYHDQPSIEVYPYFNNGTQNITHITVGATQINTTASGAIIIPYTGAGQRFPSYSATDVLHNKLSTAELKPLANSIVFVGSSASRLKDIASTPFENGYPGIHLQAVITHALLHPETIPVEPHWLSIALLIILCLVGIALSIGLAFSRIAGLIAMLFLLPLAFIGLAVYLWLERQLSIPLVIPLFLILSIVLVHMAQRIFQAYRRKRQIQQMFGQYVSASHIKQLLDKDKQGQNFAGDKRYMSVLFADIRDFTQLSEQLSTDQIKRLLNCYFTRVSAALLKHEGTIDKFVGDMVMAFWNAPLPDKQHAKHAIQAALDMLLVVTQDMKSVLAEEKLPPIKLEIGIGISTGWMNVGDMGSQHRRAYTVIGDTVNIGARLESLTKFYQVSLLFTEATKKACERVDAETQYVTSPWLFRYIDCVRVKGKEEAVKIYDVIGEPSTVGASEQQTLADYHQAIEHFLKREWIQAQQIFQRLSDGEPEVFLYRHYLTRIECLLREPPEVWDGVYRFLEK